MKKFLRVLLVVTVLLLGTMKVAHASSFVNLNIKNNGVIIYSGTIPLSSTPSEDNVLSVIKQADALSPDFNISNIVHYGFGDYLKCITISGTTELCDNWQYKVNGDSPALGMDSCILSGGENILLYFGDDIAATESAMTGGGPLTTGYVPPPAPVTAVIPTSTPEPESAVLPLLPTKSPILIPKPKTKEKNLSITGKGKTTATINAITNFPNTPNSNTTPKQTPQPQKSWFRKLLENIFNF